LKTPIERLNHNVTQQIESANETLAKFKTDFERNPQYALSWSLDAFSAAAYLDQFTALQRWLGNQRFLCAVAEHTREALESHTRDVFGAASQLQHSTSPTSNISDAAAAKAKIAIIELLTRFLKDYEADSK
jgi:hypothetical protein